MYLGVVVNGDVVLDDSRSEEGSTYPQGVINKLSQRTVILPQQQHLAEGVIHPSPEKVFQGLNMKTPERREPTMNSMKQGV